MEILNGMKIYFWETSDKIFAKWFFLGWTKTSNKNLDLCYIYMELC